MSDADGSAVLWQANSGHRDGQINSMLVGGVASGVFTADLDFGRIFNGTQYWLEIKVGTTIGNEEALAPRQPINTVPVAQYALNTPPQTFAEFYHNCFVQEIVRAFYYGWYAEVLTGLPPLANGQITVPEGPGVELRPDVLERPDCHWRMTRAGDV